MEHKMLFLLFSLVVANDPPVRIPEPSLCNTNGYLPGVDLGFDCCTFIVCDNARGNKTGFAGHCMGGSAWNQELLTCDDPKYVDGCDPLTDCMVPKRTNEPCVASDNTETTCCSGVKKDKNGVVIYPGYHPILSLGQRTNMYGGRTYYTVEGSDVEQECTKIPQYDNPEDYEYYDDYDITHFILDFNECHCTSYPIGIPPCDDDPDTFYYVNPADPCCSFYSCWANRTGFDIIQCMPPSVWNDEAKACDIPQNVMDCMDADCGQETTDPPCPGTTDGGDCCRAGLDYYMVDGDDTQYTMNYDPRVLYCPTDINGVQMVFNFDTNVCCCELTEA